jgi:DNA-directed RNA polymerase specialized sigma54-like protein
MNSLALQQAQRQSQTLTLGPQLQNSLKILQVPAAELRTSILKELQATASVLTNMRTNQQKT